MVGGIIERFRDWRLRTSALREIRSLEKDREPYAHFDIGVVLNRVKTAAFQENKAATLAAWHELRVLAPDLAMTSATALRALASAGHTLLADEQLIEAQKKFPTSSELPQLYAEMAHRRGEWEEANRRWEIVRKRFPANLMAHTLGAVSLKELVRLDEADKVLARGLTLDPNDQIAAFEYARVAVCRLDWTEALRRWEQARDRVVDNVTPWVEAARCMLKLDREAEAIALLESAQERFQSSFLPSVALARIPHDRADWAQALERWEKLRELFPQAPQAWVQGGEALVALGRASDAEALLLRGADRFQGTNETGPMFSYAVLAHRRKDWVEAARRWDMMRQWHPAARQGYIWGAEALEFAGDKDGAAEIRGQAPPG